jgi:predicted XRE-type DNA-binding protein
VERIIRARDESGAYRAIYVAKFETGFDPAEAKVMALRAEVMIRIEQHLKAQGCTQAEAAKRLGITQPRVSRLIKGKWQDFSLDMLLTLAARAGLKPELKLAA